MGRSLFSSIFIFFAVSLSAGDAWNQPQIDKAAAFQKMFNGTDRGDGEDGGAVSNTSSSTYTIIGVAAVLIIGAASVVVLQLRKPTKPKPADDDEDDEWQKA